MKKIKKPVKYLLATLTFLPMFAIAGCLSGPQAQQASDTVHVVIDPQPGGAPSLLTTAGTIAIATGAKPEDATNYTGLAGAIGGLLATGLSAYAATQSNATKKTVLAKKA